MHQPFIGSSASTTSTSYVVAGEHVCGINSTRALVILALHLGGVFYSCLGHREGAYNPCPKWARIYRLMTESGSKAFPASRAPEV